MELTVNRDDHEVSTNGILQLDTVTGMDLWFRVLSRACTELGDHGGEDMSLWEALSIVAVVGGQNYADSSGSLWRWGLHRWTERNTAYGGKCREQQLFCNFKPPFVAVELCREHLQVMIELNAEQNGK
ncbi:hypothetical protein Sjap_005137 [Stephania japonica]|uniref:Uncharacterized protein n=1 Tax=Stephania japonica TaxID=461633 RepID=A0AAP0K4U4_9MAGN